jgi:hypothetical protein
LFQENYLPVFKKEFTLCSGMGSETLGDSGAIQIESSLSASGLEAGEWVGNVLSKKSGRDGSTSGGSLSKVQEHLHSSLFHYC